MKKFEYNFCICLEPNQNDVVEKLTSDSIGGSPPASNSKTFQFGFSLKRLATTEPTVNHNIYE